MMEERKKMMHVGAYAGDIAEYVFLPGSPERAEKMSQYLDDVHEVAYNREYHSYTGTLDGVRVSICSTGMGGPSSCIAVEELNECGGKTMIRVGTCESTSDLIHKHDLVIPNGAVRMEGVSVQYSPIEYPAVPDSQVMEALVDAAEQLDLKYSVGTVITRSNFHTAFQLEDRPWNIDLTARWNAYEAAGALCTDVTTAPILVGASALQVRAAAVLCCTCDRGMYSDDAAAWPEECEDLAIRVAIKGMRLLIARDKK